MSLTRALPKSLKEIRLHLCQTSASSSGLRGFLVKSYAPLKEANPDLKVLVREASGVPAKAFMRFEQGVEHQVGLSDLSEGEVTKALEQLLAKGPGSA